ncbi:MBL fold metallo-hydrolase [Actinospica durhamensis]|uniref:MBL fold metallo-hydrolase n=1 Tax=Actinospica durhamensis TaxID=1508375 RepID=A0A941EME9_9ACTN|nr:alkyl sulfatase dimerization domain-containing protein [Actinospica durhamensis]MBR7833796.1 MBL fold metallo-hydrolase [Actinospica durhamensis]
MAMPSFGDHTDFRNADRGFVADLDPGVVCDATGAAVWDNDAYAFLSADCPPTANPSLWRQGRLCSRQGLYEVTAGIYQVRGLDLSHMTLVEGDSGVLVVDPLISVETAAAALGLYRAHRGPRPVTGVIYTHSHVDHFGGVRGVLPPGHPPVPILAPAGFLEHAVAENVYAGNAMARRAVYMYGATLPKAPDGQIGAGLGMTTSTGTVSLIPPTVEITATGQQETVDGIRIVFQLTPGTEAPAEMNFLFPDHRALCLAENATHTQHNILTLRGALVRDARVWARYLDEAIVTFADSCDVAFASHHWPTWGRAEIVEYLELQRDFYAYLHDQTLRLLNRGLTGPEIAEEFELPPALEQSWATRGYYGSVSHNVKAIYQRYLGWFDGNPAHLWEHPPVELAVRYVESLGGTQAVLELAEHYVSGDDPRFAATLLQHAVFADPQDAAARSALADVYEHLGYAAENGTWRNFFLVGASELRGGVSPAATTTTGPEMMLALSVDQVIDSLAVRLDGPRAADARMRIDLHVTDEARTWRLALSHGALIPRPHEGAPDPADPADLTLTLTKPQLLGLLGSGGRIDELEHGGDLVHSGDPAVLRALLGLLDTPDPRFPVVTP